MAIQADRGTSMKRLILLLAMVAFLVSGCSVEQQPNGKVQMKLAGATVGSPVSQAVCDAVAGFLGAGGGTLGATAFVAPMGNVSPTTKASYIVLGGLGGSVLGAVAGAYFCS